MTDKINRREDMVRVASTLFVRDGYKATSVRDIAREVGCTEAALYYHFKDGKRALFQLVLETVLPKLFNVIEECRGATSLSEVVSRFTKSLTQVMMTQAQWFGLIVSEFPSFGSEECSFFYEKHRAINENFIDIIRPLMPDDHEAQQTVWVITCITIGYMQLFYRLGLKSVSYGKHIRLVDLLSRALSLDMPESESP